MPTMGELQQVNDRRRTLAKRLGAMTKERDALGMRLQEVTTLKVTPTRRMLSSGVSNLSSYLISGHAYTGMIKRGWAPMFPVDGVVGIVGELATAFGRHWALTTAHDVFRGMADGALGRTGAFQRLDRSTAGGRVCLLLPLKKNGANGNGNGNGNGNNGNNGNGAANGGNGNNGGVVAA